MLFSLNITPCKKSTYNKTKTDTCVACNVKVILNQITWISTNYAIFVKQETKVNWFISKSKFLEAMACLKPTKQKISFK